MNFAVFCSRTQTCPMSTLTTLPLCRVVLKLFWKPGTSWLAARLSAWSYWFHSWFHFGSWFSKFSTSCFNLLELIGNFLVLFRFLFWSLEGPGFVPIPEKLVLFVHYLFLILSVIPHPLVFFRYCLLVPILFYSLILSISPQPCVIFWYCIFVRILVCSYCRLVLILLCSSDIVSYSPPLCVLLILFLSHQPWMVLPELVQTRASFVLRN